MAVADAVADEAADAEVVAEGSADADLATDAVGDAEVVAEGRDDADAAVEAVADAEGDKRSAHAGAIPPDHAQLPAAFTPSTNGPPE